MKEEDIKEKFRNIDFDKTCRIQAKIKNSLSEKKAIPTARRIALAGAISAAILVMAIISHKAYLKPQASIAEAKKTTYQEMLAYNNINKYPYYKSLGEEK